MEVLDIRAIEGRNIYSHRPVIKMTVDIKAFDDIPTKDIPGFNESLIELLPGLNTHRCSVGRPGGFIRRLEEGTYLAHVIEHIALELQSILGYDIYYGKTRGAGERGIYNIIFEYRSRVVGEEVAELAFRTVKDIVSGKAQIDIMKELKRIEREASLKELGPSTKAITDEAKKRGIPVIRLDNESLLQLGYGKNQRRIRATITDKTSCLGVDIACDKTLTKQILSKGGIPVPCGGVAYNEDEALNLAVNIGFPVVIKPCDGNQGKGVSLNLLDEADVRTAFRVASVYSHKIIVEKFIKGRHYRVLVVNGRACAVSERIPAHVVGDGIHTIRELIDIVNEDPIRGEQHEKPLTRIKIDPVVIMVLARQRLTLESVPEKGRQIFLRENGNLSTGGTAVDVTDKIHPENALLAERAVKLIGLDVAGVDITTEDISLPVCETGGAVIEVNAAPGIRMHHYPVQGEPRNVAADIVDMLFPAGRESRIPIVSITGTNGKTTTTRMIGHILKVSGYNVGMTTTDGIYINEKKIIEGDTTGPTSAKTVLMAPDVDAAVLETARGGIIRDGLGYDLSDVGVITNIAEDHLGQNGIETLDDMAMVKSLVVEAVKDDGCSVLNADDPYVVRLVKHARGRVIFFSCEEDNIVIKKHLAEGGTAVYVKNGWITLARGDETKRVIKVTHIPATLKGKAKHNIANSLAAVSAVIGLGIPVESAKKAMRSFKSNIETNPGRLNIIEISGIKVMIDYGHNPAGVENIISTAKHLGFTNLIGVITCPGDRRDDSIINLGKVAGKGFNSLIIKEDEDLRGRNPGEVASLLEKGALLGGMKKEKIKIILSEKEAVKHAIAGASEGDMVIIFYEKFDRVINAVEEVKIEFERNIAAVKKNTAGETAG